jgi:hypothetical protein
MDPTAVPCVALTHDTPYSCCGARQRPSRGRLAVVRKHPREALLHLPPLRRWSRRAAPAGRSPVLGPPALPLGRCRGPGP